MAGKDTESKNIADNMKAIEDGEEFQLPEIIPVVPVKGAVLFPSMLYPFFVNGEMPEKSVDTAMAMPGGHFIFVAAVKNETVDINFETPENINEIGTVGVVMRMLRVETGGIKMLVQGLFRARALKITLEDSLMSAKVERLKELPAKDDKESVALLRNVFSQIERLSTLGKSIPPEFLAMLKELKEPGRLADLVASSLDLQPGDAQSILEQLDPLERLYRISRLVAGELEILELQNRIKSNVNEEMESNQKKYFLREQIKAIQKELGESDAHSSDINKLREMIEAAGMTKEAEKQSLSELDRLARMHPDSAEASVIRTYIDLMASLPWSKSTEDTLDLKAAREVLDEDHYGLEKVKDRIVEHLAIRKLKPDARGSILCFSGPPGVGKTSLGQSIARALNRKFVRLSVGGMRDESEIRGHRRTYVGALPGRIINNLKTAGFNNPVFMIDEIDKMGSDFRGDPASAMLEVLDPAQNSTFTDHYLDVPFDLSKVMFITTANVLHSIPPPLRDRMEVIQIAGYTEEEKTAISMKYLIPRQIEACGLKPSRISIKSKAVEMIIRGYTREAGVRNLEREIGKVCRKVAVKVALGDTVRKHIISPKDVPEYLGAQRVEQSAKRSHDEIGVVNALAWTEAGGEVLLIEALMMEGRGNLILTGQLGNVMKESIQAANSLVRSRAEKYNLEYLSDATHDIHVHVPAGAVQKDGPSAGIAMTVALLSIYSQKPVRSDVAMTGEISLRGKALPIGGLKEKILAAKREGVSTIIIPDANRNDLSDMKKEELAGIKIVLAKTIDDVIPHVFRNGLIAKKDKGSKILKELKAMKKTDGS